MKLRPQYILVTDEKLKLADFGQSVLLPIDADVDTDTVCEEDLTAKSKLFTLAGSSIRSAVWRVHEYCLFTLDFLQ